MRRGWVALLAMVSMGTVASSVRGQAAAPTASAAPATSAQPAPSASTTGSDESTPPMTYQLALRVGFSDPIGDITNFFAGSVPIWVDLGYRISPKIVIGAFAQYGVLFVKGCPDQPCQGYDLHFGGEVHYHFAPYKQLDPWVGAGAGYELTGNLSSGSKSQGAIEFFNAQAGLDFKPGFGPFFAFSVDQFSSNGQSSTDQWLTLGVRGVYDW